MARGEFAVVRGKRMMSSGRYGVMVSKIAKKPEPDCLTGRGAPTKKIRGTSEGRSRREQS